MLVLKVCCKFILLFTSKFNKTDSDHFAYFNERFAFKRSVCVRLYRSGLSILQFVRIDMSLTHLVNPLMVGA